MFDYVPCLPNLMAEDNMPAVCLNKACVLPAPAPAPLLSIELVPAPALPSDRSNAAFKSLKAGRLEGGAVVTFAFPSSCSGTIHTAQNASYKEGKLKTLAKKNTHVAHRNSHVPLHTKSSMVLTGSCSPGKEPNDFMALAMSLPKRRKAFPTLGKSAYKASVKKKHNWN